MKDEERHEKTVQVMEFAHSIGLGASLIYWSDDNPEDCSTENLCDLIECSEDDIVPVRIAVCIIGVINIQGNEDEKKGYNHAD